MITLGAYSITSFVLPRILAKTTGPGGGAGALGGSQICCTYTNGFNTVSQAVSDVSVCNNLCTSPGSPNSRCAQDTTKTPPACQ